MNIAIAPDSFKDCLSAQKVGEALAKGIKHVIPSAICEVIPMADGGEGTVESLIDATSGRKVEAQALDPLLRERKAFFGITGDGNTAIIEMAAASGLELLPPAERNPWITSTFGTGQLILHALDLGCRNILLGIGGSATNDGGCGMARALGARFLDASGKELPDGGGALGELHSIDLSDLDHRISHCSIRVACDVSNPLTGPEGASAVYGPQKGADEAMVNKLDKNLEKLAGIIAGQLGKEVDQVPGAGAAGGLGAGLMAFLDASLMKGFDMVAEAMDLASRLDQADLVITGEGRIDAQTAFGKTPFGVAQTARVHGKPVVAVAGSLDPGSRILYQQGFHLLLPIQEMPVSLEESIRDAPLLLERCGERIGYILLFSSLIPARR